MVFRSASIVETSKVKVTLRSSAISFSDLQNASSIPMVVRRPLTTMECLTIGDFMQTDPIGVVMEMLGEAGLSPA